MPAARLRANEEPATAKKAVPMPVIPIEDVGTFESARTETGDGFVFKHSTRCPISSEAESQVDAFLREHPDVPVWRVLVVEHRPASLAIADLLEVPHASPQVILLAGGEVRWHTSHWDVTEAALRAEWEAAASR